MDLSVPITTFWHRHSLSDFAEPDFYTRNILYIVLYFPWLLLYSNVYHCPLISVGSRRKLIHVLYTVLNNINFDLNSEDKPNQFLNYHLNKTLYSLTIRLCLKYCFQWSSLYVHCPDFQQYNFDLHLPENRYIHTP